MRNINHVAVWIAGVVQFMFGAGWYTLLGKTWMEGIGKDEVQLAAEIGHSPLPYIISLATGLVIAYTLAWLLPRSAPPRRRVAPKLARCSDWR